MSVFKIGINEEGNQANHQRQHQGILCPVKIAPTIESRDASANEDYWKQSCIPSQSMEIISKHFRWSENKRSIAVMCTFY